MPRRIVWVSFTVLLAILFLTSLTVGSVSIPLSSFLGDGSELDLLIIGESRIPRSFAALFGGAALSMGGLLMQTLFRNPLAGPSVLGLTSGSTLAVAIVTMTAGFGLAQTVGPAVAAALGAMAVLLIILSVANRFADVTSVLIVGLMLSFFTSAAVSVLQAYADDSSLKAFVFWGFGSFSDISLSRLGYLIIPLIFIFAISPFLIKPLNNLLPGELHAKSMGVNIRSLRLILVLITGLLVGLVTAFCGPVAFIGLAGPHIARMVFSTPDHRIILPGSLLIGGAVAILCDLISRLPGTEYALPLNTVCAFMGAPVVVYLIIKGRKSRILT